MILPGWLEAAIVAIAIVLAVGAARRHALSEREATRLTIPQLRLGQKILQLDQKMDQVEANLAEAEKSFSANHHADAALSERLSRLEGAKVIPIKKTA